MRGHIRKRSRNGWTVVVELPRDPQTGKRRQKWVTVKGNRRDAERTLTQLLLQVDGGALGMAPTRLTVGEYLQWWLDTVKQRLRPATYESWKERLRYWYQTLGSRYLVALTPVDVQQALCALPDTLSGGTRASVFAVLRVAMRQAAKWGMVARCPTDGVKCPSPGVGRVNVWTEEQIRLFLREARGSRYYPLFHLALATGMRLGELLGLVWEDVDLDRGVIQVRRSLVGRPSGPEPRWQEPKTPRSRRPIPLDCVSLEVLRQHRKQQMEERWRAGSSWQDYGLVFSTDKGKPLQRPNITRRLKEIALVAGVPVLRFHDLRHSHATVLLRQGVHPKVVSERLGHSSVALTLDVYSHVLPDTQKEAARAMERVWDPPSVGNSLATADPGP
ncbi:MAG: tyrosine-type recombinase/integrase [Bacillota bacterium]